MPTAAVNRIGLSRDAYKGAATTLCAGCGHNSITNHLVKALYELGLEPHRLAKMSGIGCSSKTPAYFVERAHGFNGVHGRMPALATGAGLADRKLIRPETQSTLLGNRIVLVAPKDSTVQLTIAPNFELAKALGDGRLAMADVKAVPAGKYGQAALETLGVWASVKDKVAQAENVRATLALAAEYMFTALRGLPRLSGGCLMPRFHTRLLPMGGGLRLPICDGTMVPGNKVRPKLSF